MSGILTSAHVDTSQPQQTYPRRYRWLCRNSSALANLLHPWDISQDLRLAPEPSEQTLASSQPIKTINSAYRDDPSRLYDGKQAPVSVQTLWTFPVLPGMLRRWPPAPRDTSQGLEKAPPFGARLHRRCRARGHPAKSSRPCGVLERTPGLLATRLRPAHPHRPQPRGPDHRRHLTPPLGLRLRPRRGAGRAGAGGSLAEGGEGRS